MIKKIIFAVAITLSLTTHHAMCMEKEDNKSVISARLATLEGKYEKEVEKNDKLKGSYHIPPLLGPGNSGGCDGVIPPQEDIAFHQSDKRLTEMRAQKQQLEALLKKVEEQAPTS